MRILWMDLIELAKGYEQFTSLEMSYNQHQQTVLETENRKERYSIRRSQLQSVSSICATLEAMG